MKNNKGFTLVELLAVIVIMGILMMVAIPSVTRTIENSRKDTFVDIAKSYGNAARTLWTSDNLTCNGVVSSAVDDGDYYILINSKEGAKESLPVLVDQGGKSSWGNRDVNGYVRVNISTTSGEDTNGDGVYEIEPRRVTKFYVALSDGTHGLIDDNTLEMDKLKRGNVVMSLSQEDLKKIEFTLDDGKLNCAKTNSGLYVCSDITPIMNLTGVCVDDDASVYTIPSDGNVGDAEILDKETGEVVKPTETFRMFGSDISSGHAGESMHEGGSNTNYNANLYYAAINDIAVPIKGLIEQNFHSIFYGANSSVFLDRNFLNITAGELARYTVFVTWEDGRKTGADFSIQTIDISSGVSMNIPCISYHYYDQNGQELGATSPHPIYTYDSSSKTFVLSTVNSRITEDMMVYVDTAKIFTNTIKSAYSSVS